MSDESAFVRAILADPGDAALRLIYADWLEESGGPEGLPRAEYLRIECELDRLPKGGGRRYPLNVRLRQLRRLVGDDWWRQFDWSRVESCVEFEYRCPQRWDTLQPTDDPGVRYCEECRRNVHYCRTTQEALRLADQGEGVVIDSRLEGTPLSDVRVARQPNRRLRRLARQQGGRLGRSAPRQTRRIPLGERGRRRDQT